MEETKKQHSPTPWEVRENYGGLENLVFASNGQEVAACWPPNNPEPNATYIVECVNSHERLVAENARLRNALESLLAYCAAKGWDVFKELDMSVNDMVRSALGEESGK